MNDRYYFDSDVPNFIQSLVARMIDEDCAESCECGGRDVYVASIASSKKYLKLDVKCYDCGETYAEYEFEFRDS